jgi:transcriptional regulator with XRE-family HTH domain
MADRHLPYDNEICTKLINATAFNLRKFRKERGWTQTRLADRLSKFLDQRYSYQQIQKYEALNENQNKIPGIVLYAFGQLFHKPLDAFFISKEELESGAIFAGELQPTEQKVDG